MGSGGGNTGGSGGGLIGIGCVPGGKSGTGSCMGSGGGNPGGSGGGLIG
jgi:hypothetical protein